MSTKRSSLENFHPPEKGVPGIVLADREIAKARERILRDHNQGLDTGIVGQAIDQERRRRADAARQIAPIVEANIVIDEEAAPGGIRKFGSGEIVTYGDTTYQLPTLDEATNVIDRFNIG